MLITARPADNGDAAEVLELLDEARRAVEDVRGGALWLRRDATPPPLADAVAHAIRDPAALLLVATLDDCVLGVLLAHSSDDAGGRLADIRELWVTPDARGVGLGEALMAATLEWAGRTGCDGVAGRALPGDRATKNFFETHHLVARSIEVHVALADDGELRLP